MYGNVLGGKTGGIRYVYATVGERNAGGIWHVYDNAGQGKSLSSMVSV